MLTNIMCLIEIEIFSVEISRLPSRSEAIQLTTELKLIGGILGKLDVSCLLV